MVLQTHLRGIFYLGRGAAEKLIGSGSSHGTRHTYLALTAYLGA